MISSPIQSAKPRAAKLLCEILSLAFMTTLVSLFGGGRLSSLSKTRLSVGVTFGFSRSPRLSAKHASSDADGPTSIDAAGAFAFA